MDKVSIKGETMIKKKLFVLGGCILAMIGLVACGNASISYEKYDLSEYIKIGKYKGIEIDDYTISVTQDEIDEQIQRDIESAATSEKISENEVIKEGDTVNIDYIGKKDGKKFEGGSAEGYELKIGSNTFIEGFEGGLIGKAVGDKVDLNLTFPENYSSEDLAGQDVVFTVIINSATRESVPEYDLDFIKKNTKFDTVGAYENAVEEKVYEDEEAKAIDNQKNEIWLQVLDNTEVIKYPDEIVNQYIKFNNQQIDDKAESYGITREELLKSYNFSDEEEFVVANEENSKLRVKQELIIEYIAANEGLKVTNEEAEERMAMYESKGYDEEGIKRQTGRDIEGYIRTELLYEKVLDFLLENAKIKS